MPFGEHFIIHSLNYSQKSCFSRRGALKNVHATLYSCCSHLAWSHPPYCCHALIVFVFCLLPSEGNKIPRGRRVMNYEWRDILENEMTSFDRF